MNIAQIMLELISSMSHDDVVKVLDGVIKDYQSADSDHKKEEAYHSLENVTITFATSILAERCPKKVEEMIGNLEEKEKKSRPFSELEN